MPEDSQTQPARRFLINWLFWGGLFFFGTAVSGWLEWQSREEKIMHASAFLPAFFCKRMYLLLPFTNMCLYYY